MSGREYLFTRPKGNPLDKDVYRQRRLKPLLASLQIQQAGFHAFRHFNVAILDALLIPLKTLQERFGHAVTGSFTLDVYGGKPEWAPNLEAARLLGAELEKAVAETETKQNDEGEAFAIGGLTPINEEGLGAAIS